MKLNNEMPKSGRIDTVVPTIKAVIFDMDGTITRPFFDFDQIREEIGLERNAGPILEEMEKMTPDRRLEAEKILHRHEQEAIEQSQLNDGARETLKALHKAKIPIGVLTRNQKDNVYAIANKHHLHFDAVVGREDGPIKPDAFGVLHLCKKFGVKPQETMLVGDYLFDLLCAKSAGSYAVLLANHKNASEFAHRADFCIKNISELLEIIQISR
jgi:HAD superfamily hydrolase (TIGR01509 family)